MKGLKLGQIYEVIWHDAYGQLGWHGPEYFRKNGPSKCLTVGYYIGTSKAGDLLFAGTNDTDSENVNNISGRPKAMIKQIRELKQGRRVYKSRT